MVAFSSGNHAQAVALAGPLLGIPPTIVMPHDAPAVKVAATRGYGAEVVLYDRYTEDREAIGAALAAERGLTLIPPYDHPDVHRRARARPRRSCSSDVGALDALFVPLGGGGLLSGCALAARGARAGCRVYGVEPAAGDDGQRSLRSGRDRAHRRCPQTIADGAQTHAPRRAHVPDHPARTSTTSVTVDRRRARRGHAVLRERMKLVVEPTGCLGLAGVLAAAVTSRGQRVGVIVSGGNVDLDRYAALLSGTTTS